MDKSCAYCGRLGTTLADSFSTKEHVLPEFFLKDDTEERRTFFFERPLQIPSPAVINDVCNHCNNGPLSDLDAYAKNNHYSAFKENITYKSKVFRYDYKLLSRWLLKISYNNARIANLEKAYKTHPVEMIEYILGKREELPGLSIFANILPSKRVGDMVKMPDKMDNKIVLQPSRLRVSDIKLSDSSQPMFSRLVAFYNYYFYLFYPEHSGIEKTEDFICYVLLNQKSKVILKSREDNFLDTMRATRDEYPEAFKLGWKKYR